MENCILHFLPAKGGDCFVIELDNKECILVDCGYKSTYENELKPLLIKLKDKGCRIILMLITHIDQDHIEGAIAFLLDNGPANAPNIIEVENIWFNGFFNTLFMNEKFNKRKMVIVSEGQKKEMDRVLSQLSMQIYGDTGFISAAHSRSFEELCAHGRYCLNEQFTDRIVKRSTENKKNIADCAVQIGGCRLRVLAPNEELLGKLAEKLNIEMIKNFGINYEISNDREFAALFELFMKLQIETSTFAEYISAPGPRLENWIQTSTLAKMNEVNNSSIVIEIEYKNLRLLFTGDSDSDNWADFLMDEYDLIKISHHGTTKPNIKLLEKTRGKKLLISTDGGKQKRHPEKELLARVILSGNKRIYFNYDIKQKQELLDMQEEYGYSVMFGHREIKL